MPNAAFAISDAICPANFTVQETAFHLEIFLVAATAAVAIGPLATGNRRIENKTSTFRRASVKKIAANNPDNLLPSHQEYRNMIRWLIRAFRKESARDRTYGPVVVQGRQLSCNVCSYGIFWEHQVQLHTPFMTFLDLEEWNRVADCAVCARCGHIHWFISPESLPREE